MLASGSAGNCQAIDSITVTVNSFPLTITATKQIVCGATDTLRLNAVATGGTFSYQWTPASFLSDATIANPIVTPPLGATTYTVTVNNSVTGCSKSKSITVYHQDPQLLTSTGDSVCGPQNVDLFATVSAGAQVNWYSQSSGGFSLHTGSPFTTLVLRDSTFYVSASEPAQQTPVSTGFAGGIIATDPNAAGNMFNIRALHNIKVTGFDVHLNNAALAASNISVYYKLNL